MSAARILSIVPASPAATAGLSVGDELLALNGEALRDVIRYQTQADEAFVEIELRRGGVEQTVVVEKAAGEPLGLELDGAVFDRVRTCDNHCPFCFIHQLPKGMRRTLYMKDDDYRLSFLYGNFTTLTRFTEADLERVITEGLGPLYVSIHATDPDVRTALLRNNRGATSLRWLSALLDAGVEVHGQVVLCPGINDGDILSDTLFGVLDRFPQLKTVGVVPLGVSDHNHEESMRAHTPAEAADAIDRIHAWQQVYLDLLGRRLVYASDELYLVAGRPLPELADYDDVQQHENGIGMARTFEHEVRAAIAGAPVDEEATPKSGFFAWVEGAPAEGYRAPRTTDTMVATSRIPTKPLIHTKPRRDAPITIVTGTYGAQVLAPLMDELAAVSAGPLRILPIENRFFGGNTAVTGLITGADLGAVLHDQPTGERYLVPDVVLSNGVFLDGASPADLPRPVEFVPTSGTGLVAALRRS